MTIHVIDDEEYERLGEAEKRRIIEEALYVAIAPAVQQKGDTFAARVPWNRIHRLRGAFRDADVDWMKAKGPDQTGS